MYNKQPFQNGILLESWASLSHEDRGFEKLNIWLSKNRKNM